MTRRTWIGKVDNNRSPIGAVPAVQRLFLETRPSYFRFFVLTFP